MLLSLPRPQIIQNRGDGHAAFDEGCALCISALQSQAQVPTPWHSA